VISALQFSNSEIISARLRPTPSKPIRAGKNVLWFNDYHSIPQVVSVGLKTLMWNVPIGLKHGILSPDFGWKQGILFRWIYCLCELLGAGLVGDISKMSRSLLLKKSLNLSNVYFRKSSFFLFWNCSLLASVSGWLFRCEYVGVMYPKITANNRIVVFMFLNFATNPCTTI
jgi:hypothetical protein